LACTNSSWYGNKCSKDCPYSCFNGACDINTGSCKSCYPGFYGSTCQPCLPGHYGKNCEKSCRHGCEGACDKETGACHVCKTGFFQPPFCFSCSESILNCAVCRSAQKCDLCDIGYNGERCTNRSFMNCSKCEDAPCLCSGKPCSVNASEVCEDCIERCPYSTSQIMEDTTKINHKCE
jgi:hypothetical protein